jgi:molybdopterin converting factor subunit 1
MKPAIAPASTPRTVRVRLFARARELARTDALDIALAESATVADLRAQLHRVCPALAGLLERSAIAVNDEFAEDETLLPAGAEVAVLPPVSGGGPWCD